MLIHGLMGRICRRICCGNKCEPKNWRRLDNLIKNGESRFYAEMDIVNVVNALRLFKVFLARSFSPEKRMLLQMQRSQVIESSSQDDHDKIWNADNEYMARIFNR